MRSIRRRLSLGLGGALVVVFLLAGVASSLAIRQGLRDYMITRLDHDAESLLTALRLQRRRGAEPRLATTDPIYGRAYSGHYFKVLVDGEALRSRSLWEHDLEVPAVATGEARTLVAEGPGGEALLVRVHGFQRRGSPVVVAVAEDYGAVRATILRWQLGFGLATLLAILLVLWLQRRILARELAPLERTRAEVRELERGERRALTAAGPAEIMPLIAALNRLLETLEDRLRRSRKAAGDLAHGLKTPLSMLHGLAARPGTDPALRAGMTRQLAVIQGRMERELRRARLVGGAPPGALFRPETDVADLAETLRRLHRDRPVALETSVTGDSPYPADREDMLELLGNLLDNAFKWAGSRVVLTVAATAQGLAVTVEDDGPGIPPADRDRLARRGERLDESREGHGLGLAIVGDIVSLYHGTLELGRSATLGGLRVRATLGHPRG